MAHMQGFSGWGSGSLRRWGGITGQLKRDHHRGPMIGALGALALGPSHAKGDPHQVVEFRLGVLWHPDEARSHSGQF
jgi:hypothetical protein